MANNIELVTVMTDIVDEIYQAEAVTNVLEVPSELVRYTGGKGFEVANIAMSGLGDYSKADGYKEGSVNLTWETHTFTNDRGIRFSVDREDNEETFGLIASRLNGDFTRNELVPEIDATRFAKIATKAGHKVEGTVTKTNALSEIDEAIVTLTDNKVPTSRLVLFCTPRVKLALQNNITRSTSNNDGNINNLVETYNGIPIYVVPQDRFYTEIELNSGDVEFGYEKAVGGADINFILMDKNASLNIAKLNMLKYFSPDENQKKDAHQWDYRLYHESFVFANKTNGIYVHKKSVG